MEMSLAKDRGRKGRWHIPGVDMSGQEQSVTMRTEGQVLAFGYREPGMPAQRAQRPSGPTGG